MKGKEALTEEEEVKMEGEEIQVEENIEDNNMVVVESDNDTQLDEQETEPLPTPTLERPPLPSCETTYSSTSQIAECRAKNSLTRQRESIGDTVQSIQMNGSVQSRASDLAAQRLHALNSLIEEDSLVSSEQGPVKKVFRSLFPVF